MSSQQKENTTGNSPSSIPTADTGNASNPSPGNRDTEPANDKPLLDEKAEKYLREAGNIEDIPDARDQQDMDETLRQERNRQ
jgi:hypothetical protein